MPRPRFPGWASADSGGGQGRGAEGRTRALAPRWCGSPVSSFRAALRRRVGRTRGRETLSLSAEHVFPFFLKPVGFVFRRLRTATAVAEETAHILQLCGQGCGFVNAHSLAASPLGWPALSRRRTFGSRVEVVGGSWHPLVNRSPSPQPCFNVLTPGRDVSGIYCISICPGKPFSTHIFPAHGQVVLGPFLDRLSRQIWHFFSWLELLKSFFV